MAISQRLRVWVALIAVSVIFIAALLGYRVFTHAQDPLSLHDELVRRGDPQELKFLQHLRLPRDLESAVAKDVRDLPAADAHRQITRRLRLDLVSLGVIEPRLARLSMPPAGLSSEAVAPSSGGANNGGPEPTAEDVTQWQADLHALARDPKPASADKNLEAALPDTMVIATAATVYGTPGAINIPQNDLQTLPGTPVTPSKPGTPATPGPEGDEVQPTVPALSTNVVIARAPAQGAVPAQTLPGTSADHLTDCEIPFDRLAATCGGIKNGQRCEKFSRTQFPEVAKIITPTGALCSGTVIGAQWILSAAHCFLPTDSALHYGSLFANRQDANGNAVLQNADLRQTEVHLPYAQLDDDRVAIVKVIVNQQWNPTLQLAPGDPITIGATELAANFIYPGDLALIQLAAPLSLKGADASVVLQPAVVPVGDYDDVITTAGYGYTTVGNGAAGDLWVTWPTPKVASTHGQLELRLSGGPAISTFCRGDSGGPAYEGRQRGCFPGTGEAPRPRPLIGVISYFYGNSLPNATPAQNAQFCMSAPVMRFVNLSALENRNWICRESNRAVGCPAAQAGRVTAPTSAVASATRLSNP